MSEYVQVNWGGVSPLNAAEIANGITWATEHGYPVHIWQDVDASGQPVTLTRIMTPSGETVALYEGPARPDPYIPALAAALARAHVAGGMGNLLVSLPSGTDIPGAQHDDHLTAIAAADLVDYLTAHRQADDLTPQQQCQAADPIAGCTPHTRCPDHKETP